MSEPRKLTPFEASLDRPDVRDVQDRIAFILVRDGISRKALAAAVAVDHSAPYYKQDQTPIDLLITTADFLGVSVEWLLTGKGRNTREKPGLLTRSAVVSGNTAHIINVNNYPIDL